MSGRVAGKVALISGAARGMGESHARLLAREGASVVIGDLLHDQGRELARVIAADGGQAIYVPLDVTVETDWQAAYNTAMLAFGRLDVLVNNAGIAPQQGPLEQLSLEQWNQVIGINLTGAFLGMKHAIPHMRHGGGGSIINICSTAALIGYMGIPAYAASKGALRALTRQAATEYAKDLIRVNAVFPGLIETPMNANSTPERMKMLADKVPLGQRRGRPEEVSQCVLHLASDESAFTTGGEFVIDGGFSAQ
jgi:NAD(P)-dependent dehydrogenase (short-subunit alcohol dehydrogenase family)